jgi:hypothetical protein
MFWKPLAAPEVLGIGYVWREVLLLQDPDAKILDICPNSS